MTLSIAATYVVLGGELLIPIPYGKGLHHPCGTRVKLKVPIFCCLLWARVWEGNLGLRAEVHLRAPANIRPGICTQRKSGFTKTLFPQISRFSVQGMLLVDRLAARKGICRIICALTAGLGKVLRRMKAG